MSEESEIKLWKLKFKDELGRVLNISGDDLDDLTKAEQENYFDDCQLWKDYNPRDAVSENLSCWGD